MHGRTRRYHRRTAHPARRRNQHVLRRTPLRGGVTVLVLLLPTLLLAAVRGAAEADDGRGPVHATEAGVLLRPGPGGHGEVEQRHRAGPLQQAAHLGDLRDRHPAGVHRQGLQVEGARQVGLRHLRAGLREVPGRRREPGDADPAQLGLVPSLGSAAGTTAPAGIAATWSAVPPRPRSTPRCPPRAKGLFRAKPPEQWLTCALGETVLKSKKVACTQQHDWRAVTTIKIGKPEGPLPRRPDQSRSARATSARTRSARG